MACSMAQNIPQGLDGLDESAKKTAESQVVDYITNFLTFYKEEIQKLAPDLKSSKENLTPPLFAGLPCEVKAYILPNRAVCAMFKYNAKETKVEVIQADYSKLRQILEHEPQNNFMLFPPFKIFTKETAISDAKHSAECDFDRLKLASECNAVKGSITEVQAKYAEIAKANPWLEKQFKLIQDALAKVKSLIVSTEESLTKFDTDEKYTEYDGLLALIESIKLAPKIEYKPTELEKYIKSFIKHYRDIHSEKTSKTKTKKLTPFYAGYPYSIKISNLENGTVWLLFKFRASALSVETTQPSFQEFESNLMKKDYDYFLVFPPGKDLSAPDKDAKLQVEYELAKFDARSAVEDSKLLVLGVQKKTNEIIKTNPWLDKQFKVILDLLSKSIQPLENLSKGITQIEKKDTYYRAEHWHIELKTYAQHAKDNEMKVIEINLAEVQPTEEDVFFEEIDENIEEKTTYEQKVPQAVAVTTPTEKVVSQAVAVPTPTEKVVSQAVAVPISTEKTVTSEVAHLEEEKKLLQEQTTSYTKSTPEIAQPIIEEAPKVEQPITSQEKVESTALVPEMAKVEGQPSVQKSSHVEQSVSVQEITPQKPTIDPEAEAQAQIIRQLEALVEKQQFAVGQPEPFQSYNGHSKDDKNIQSYSTETVSSTVQEYTEGKIETFRVDNPYANLTSTPEEIVTPQPTVDIPHQADINELKSKLYQQEKKLSDFQRKLDYMEKYMEKVQE
ncbi:MAG: hypothetical protein QXT63_08370, partial [Thermoplasmata archaeon]